jgi:hypothetical protein
LAISSQNSFCTSRRRDGAPGDFNADLPVNSLTQLDGLPINTSNVGALRRPIEFTLIVAIGVIAEAHERRSHEETERVVSHSV